jgi:hypothetical protein
MLHLGRLQPYPKKLGWAYNEKLSITELKSFIILVPGCSAVLGSSFGIMDEGTLGGENDGGATELRGDANE